MTLKKIISIKNIGRFINSAAPGNPELPTYTLMLGKCDGTALQNWRFENYRLSLKAHPDKCLTIGAEPSRLTRGGRRLPSRHMARSLALANCSEEALERQLWRMEKPMDRTGAIMPFK